MPKCLATSATTYLHVRIGQSRIRDDRWATIKYLHSRVGHPGLTAQHLTHRTHLALVAGLLLQFADGRLLGGFAGVDQAGRELDTDGVNGRAVLKRSEQCGRFSRIIVYLKNDKS